MKACLSRHHSCSLRKKLPGDGLMRLLVFLTRCMNPMKGHKISDSDCQMTPPPKKKECRKGKNGPRLAGIVHNVGRAPRRAFGAIAALTAMLVSMPFPQHTSRYLVPPDRILHCPYNHSNHHHHRPTHVIWNLLTTTWWVRGSFCGQRMVQSYGLRSERFGHCD